MRRTQQGKTTTKFTSDQSSKEKQRNKQQATYRERACSHKKCSNHCWLYVLQRQLHLDGKSHKNTIVSKLSMGFLPKRYAVPMVNYTSAAVFPQQVACFTWGVRSFHCSLASAKDGREFIDPVVHVFLEENYLSSTMVKC